MALGSSPLGSSSFAHYLSGTEGQESALPPQYLHSEGSSCKLQAWPLVAIETYKLCNLVGAQPKDLNYSSQSGKMLGKGKRSDIHSI